MLKADLHIHTKYSVDCNTPLDKIINRCVELGINCIAISDHSTTEGALKMQELAPFTVIVAEEILTDCGEIMGMFLKQTVPSGLSIEQSISQVREQGGLICIPHPFDTFRGLRLDSQKIEALVEQIDIIEVFNARSALAQDLTKARTFAEKFSIPVSAGSDAHTIGEIGNAYLEMPEFNGRDDFVEALAKGKIYGHRTNPLVHFNSFFQKLKDRFRNL